MSASRDNNQTDLKLLKVTLKRKDKGESRYPEFNEFIRKYEAAMRGLAMRILRNEALAEDALQEAKLKMFRFGLNAYHPRGYYRQAVKTCSLDMRKREFPHAHMSLGPQPEEDDRPPLEFEADKSWRPDFRLDRAQTESRSLPIIWDAFNRMVDKSPSDLRTVNVLVDRFFEEKSVKTIAEERKIATPNAVSQIISRGLHKLGRVLKKMQKEGYQGVELLLETGEWA